MGFAVRHQAEHSASQINLGAVRHGHRRIDYGADPLRSESLRETLAIVFAPPLERRPQGVVAEDGRLVAGEGRGTEGVIRMYMCDQDMADRLGRTSSDLRNEPLAVRAVPSESVISTESRPMMKPILAIPPAFAGVASSCAPVRT